MRREISKYNGIHGTVNGILRRHKLKPRRSCSERCLFNISTSSSELSPVPTLFRKPLGLGPQAMAFGVSLEKCSLHLESSVNISLPCCEQDRVEQGEGQLKFLPSPRNIRKPPALQNQMDSQKVGSPICGGLSHQPTALLE